MPLDGKKIAVLIEDMSDERLRGFDAVIVPSGMVSDRLRYTEDVTKLPPATEFLQRAFTDRSILKGIICHGLWLVAAAPELVCVRRWCRTTTWSGTCAITELLPDRRRRSHHDGNNRHQISS